MGKSNHFCGQCGFHTDFTNYICGGVVKRVIVRISEAVLRLSRWWDGGFTQISTDLVVVLTRIFTDLGGFPHYVLC